MPLVFSMYNIHKFISGFWVNCSEGCIYKVTMDMRCIIDKSFDPEDYIPVEKCLGKKYCYVSSAEYLHLTKDRWNHCTPAEFANIKPAINAA